MSISEVFEPYTGIGATARMFCPEFLVLGIWKFTFGKWSLGGNMQRCPGFRV